MEEKKQMCASRRVQKALNALGFDLEVVEFPASTRTAQEAASAIGCQVGQIVKSLVFECQPGNYPLLIAASGANRVNEAAITSLLGCLIMRATPEFVRETTGYAIGGVPPIGHSESIRTLVDEDLLQYAQIWAAAGTPNSVFCLTPDQLITITNSKVCKIT